jgi:hypothetical protein
MRIVVLFVALFMLAMLSLTGASEPFKYVGSEKCKMCHKTPKQGEQYKIWSSGPHAKAYETLASEESVEIAKEMEIDDPQKSDQCLSCHITAFGVADSLKMETLTLGEGVSCEACHGAGSEYKKMSIMKDQEKAVAAGLQIIEEETCTRCHNEKSPTYKPFKFEEAVKVIAHPKPEIEAKD